MQIKRVKMNTIPAFEQTLMLGLIGSVVSLIPDMNEGIRFLILIATFFGVVIKVWEQIKKSEHFKNDVIELWKKISGRK